MSLGWEIVTAIDATNPTVGDLRIVNGRFSRLADSPTSIAQACTVELRWFLGEWSFDTRRGVPYFDKLLKRGVTAATIRAVIGRTLRGVRGVLRMKSADISIDHVTRMGKVTNVIVTLSIGGVVQVGNSPFPVGR